MGGFLYLLFFSILYIFAHTYISLKTHEGLGGLSIACSGICRCTTKTRLSLQNGNIGPFHTLLEKKAVWDHPRCSYLVTVEPTLD